MCHAAFLILALPAALAAAPARDAPERAADIGGKIVCKRFTRIGSLVASYKECKTKREWENERVNLRTQSLSGICHVSTDPVNGSVLAGGGNCS